MGEYDYRTRQEAKNTKDNQDIQSEGLVKKIKDKFINEKVDYYDIFISGACILQDAGKSLKNAMANGEIKKELLYIQEIKKNGTKYVNDSLKLVADAFITPIDQRDIIEILLGIEIILHSIESVANHFYILQVGKSDENMKRLVDITNTQSDRLYDLMIAFKEYKSSTRENVDRLIKEINELEDEGDRVYSESMFTLFSTETNEINIIKKKEIYERLEYSLDCFKREADMVGNLIIASM